VKSNKFYLFATNILKLLCGSNACSDRQHSTEKTFIKVLQPKGSIKHM